MSLPLAGKQIVITRPLDQAQTLAALISAAGGTPTFFPLIAIVPLDDLSAFHRTITPLNAFDWAIFISSNAVQYGLPSLLAQGLSDRLQFAAIGPVTAAALQAAGVAKVITPQGRFDSESLLALPMFQDLHGQRILIVRGVGGREVMAETLIERGASVMFGECYRRAQPQQNALPLSKCHATQAIDGVVITSSEALSAYHVLALQSDWLQTLTLFVNHARIAEKAKTLGYAVQCADAPGDQAMCTLMCRFFTQS